MNLLPIITPVIGKIAPVITEKIQTKVFPSEIKTAILAGMKAAEAEEKKTIQVQEPLFYTSKPYSLTGVKGFLDNYFNIAAVQNELANSFNNKGKPNVDYLVAEFKRIAGNYEEVNPREARIKPWLNTFVNVYFETTSTYLKFQVAKEGYFKQLNKRYNNIKFAGMAVSGQEEAVKELQQIFVMPDVLKMEEKETLFSTEFISEALSPQQQLIREQRQLARLTNTSSSPFLAKKLLTETPTKKAVILGAPGSGKSTLISYFAVMLTQGKAQDLGLGRF